MCACTSTYHMCVKCRVIHTYVGVFPSLSDWSRGFPSLFLCLSHSLFSRVFILFSLVLSLSSTLKERERKGLARMRCGNVARAGVRPEAAPINGGDCGKILMPLTMVNSDSQSITLLFIFLFLSFVLGLIIILSTY